MYAYCIEFGHNPPAARDVTVFADRITEAVRIWKEDWPLDYRVIIFNITRLD